MSLRSYYKKKKKQETPVILIILGLLLIFIIGYAFWHSENHVKTISQPKSEPSSLEKLKSLLSKKRKEKVEKEKLLETKVLRRRKLFFWARLTLVVLMLCAFCLLQFVWVPEIYQDTNIIDNLRNFITTIVLGFTTVAFVSKGNLKSFKESIEEMALNEFFTDEETLKMEIDTLNYEIEFIENHIKRLEGK